MATSYFWPFDNTRARAVSLTTYGSGGLAIPKWISPGTWFFDGTSVSVCGTYSLSGTCGFGSCSTDGSSGVWLTQYTGSMVHYTSGAVQTTYNLPSSVFTGTAYVPSFSSAYTITSTGQVFTPSGTGALAVGPTINLGVPTWGLVTSGSTLFTMMSGAIGTLTLSGSGAGASGFFTVPMQTAMCMAATTNVFTVGGWSQATLGSAASSGIGGLIFDPVVSNALVLRPSSARVDLYSGGGEIWGVTQSLSGILHPTYGFWAANGSNALVTDPVSGAVASITYSLGTISLSQILPLTNASGVTINSNNITAFICQPSQNVVTQLNLTGGVWASGTTFAATGATTIVSTSASGVAASYASGVAFLHLVSSTWSVQARTPLSYFPSALAVDLSGNVLAAGSLGSSGFFTAFSGVASGATISWTGSVSGMIYDQGQAVVVDPSSSFFRFFGTQATGIYSLIGTELMNISRPPIGLAVSPYTSNSVGGTVFALTSGGSGLAYQYQFVGPFSLAAVPSGVVSIYVSGAWISVGLNPRDTPTAMAFDGSGNIQVATRQNALYGIAVSGTIQSATSIPVYTQQIQSVPLGISAMTYALNHLWGVSSLNGALVRIF